MKSVDPNKTYHGKPCRFCGSTLRWKSIRSCVDCKRKKTRAGLREYRKTEKFRAYLDDYTDKNLTTPEGLAKRRKYAKSIHDPKKHREKNLLKLYGMTEADYERMLAQQNSLCWICSAEAWEQRHSRLHIDHDHKTGKVRGLLCTCCNTALGKFRDSPRLLERAINYLRETG